MVGPKKNGKWGVYIDNLDLNNAYPKGTFPMPQIDKIVDATSGHELLSFLDTYSDYNKILMFPLDSEKTSFINPT